MNRSIRSRASVACVRFALWLGRVAAVPHVEKTEPLPKRLRIEADVETPLAGDHIAAILRRHAAGSADASTLCALADARGFRLVPQGVHERSGAKRTQ